MIRLNLTKLVNTSVVKKTCIYKLVNTSSCIFHWIEARPRFRSELDRNQVRDGIGRKRVMTCFRVFNHFFKKKVAREIKKFEGFFSHVKRC